MEQAANTRQLEPHKSSAVQGAIISGHGPFKDPGQKPTYGMITSPLIINA